MLVSVVTYFLAAFVDEQQSSVSKLKFDDTRARFSNEKLSLCILLQKRIATRIEGVGLSSVPRYLRVGEEGTARDNVTMPAMTSCGYKSSPLSSHRRVDSAGESKCRPGALLAQEA